MHLNGAITVSSGQASNAGLKPENQDAVGIHNPDGALATTKGIAAVISDGVSTAEAAAKASQICRDRFLSEYFDTPETWSVKSSSEKVLAGINNSLYRRGQQYQDAQKGYVCTLSVLVLKSHQAHIFHVGDTRIYRVRDGQLEQLTRDHAVQVSQKDTFLSRAMGMDTQLQIDYKTCDLREGDRFLLSTDGIHDVLSEEQLQTTLNEISDPSKASETLIQLALEKDSKDNLSCLILEIDALPAETADDLNRRLTELPFPPHLEAGMILDGYRIEKELHASSRSQLYQVTDTESGIAYMMKTPSVNYEDDPAYMERFIMEPWIGARINSPHVMDIITLQRPRSCLYYLAEYIEGLTLASWMRQNPQPPLDEVVKMTEQMVQGLRAFQRRETLHQDLKPDNIMIDRHGNLKIVDFGSCYVSGIDEINGPITRDLILGTVDYAAPEYHLGIKAGIQADLFSLAAIVYEMLSGHRPYGDQLGKAKGDDDFLKLSYTRVFRHNPNVPLWIDGALQRALEIRPENRYPALSEFIHDLQTPNQEFLRASRKPLLERNPTGFWKGVSLLLFLLNLYLIWQLTKG